MARSWWSKGCAKGESLPGKRVVIVEDVTTTGGSAIKAVDALREAGAEIVMVFTMVDRQEGADRRFHGSGACVPLIVSSGGVSEEIDFSIDRRSPMTRLCLTIVALAFVIVPGPTTVFAQDTVKPSAMAGKVVTKKKLADCKKQAKEQKIELRSKRRKFVRACVNN